MDRVGRVKGRVDWVQTAMQPSPPCMLAASKKACQLLNATFSGYPSIAVQDKHDRLTVSRSTSQLSVECYAAILGYPLNVAFGFGARDLRAL